MSVSGHRSETSIKNYVRTSELKKREMSETLSRIHPDLDQPSTSTATASTSNLDEIENIDNDDDPENFDFTDSQLLRVMDALPLQVIPPAQLPQPQQQQDRMFGTMNIDNHMNQQNVQPQQFRFNSCVVNFYNK